MLASVGSTVPSGKDWIFEPKYDGIRIIGYAVSGQAALYSRNALDKTQQFPEIAEALSALAKKRRRPLVVDGEVVALHGGRPARFQELQGRMHVTDMGAIAGHREASPAALMVFDLLMDGDEPLVNEPWTARRARLEAAMDGVAGALRLSPYRRDGDKMLAEARAKGWEGIMAKLASAPYRPGERSRDWLKLKIEQRQEFVVGGYTEPRRSRQFLGAILLGYYPSLRSGQAQKLIYAGHTGGGFSGASLTDMYQRLRPLETDECPFEARPKTNETAHWVKPRVVVEVKFNEWTADGKLRQPIFVGVRDDKPAKSVVREGVSRLARMGTGHREQGTGNREQGTSSASEVKRERRPKVGDPSTGNRERGIGSEIVGDKKKRAAKRLKAPVILSGAKERVSPSLRSGRRTATKYSSVIAQLDRIEHEERGTGTLQLDTGPLSVTNLGKIFFPKTKHTKGDLLRYYARVAPLILPAVADRPLVLRRFPNGIHASAFYQQKAPAEAPKSVRVEEVRDEGIETQDRLIGGDLATLLYVIQLGAISIDPWHSRVPQVQFADYSIIDLDPGDKASFRRVIDVARWVKDVLDELGLHGVPKTSGASGIHVALPLGPRVPNDAARMLAEVVATTVADRHPKESTIIRQVRARSATSVYVDYLQNIRGKTVAGVYSARAKDEATVSTPLEWSEVRPGLDPRDFTIDSAPKRFADVGDLWAKGMKKSNRLERLLKRK